MPKIICICSLKGCGEQWGLPGFSEYCALYFKFHRKKEERDEFKKENEKIAIEKTKQK